MEPMTEPMTVPMTGIEPAYSAWEYLDDIGAKPVIGTAWAAAKVVVTFA